MPQDIGRVLLNLYNNAFYAVNEKAKQQTAGYKPEVSIKTKKINGKIEMVVSDNGNGIPQNIVDKIFSAVLYHQTYRLRNRVGLEFEL